MARRIGILALVDDAALRERLRDELGGSYALDLVPDLDAAVAELRTDTRFDVAICPERAGGAGGLAAAATLRAVDPRLPVIVLAAAPESRELTAAIHGQQIAWAVQLPWRPGELSAAVLRAYELGSLRGQVDAMQLRMHRRLDALAALSEVSAATADAGSWDEVARAIAAGLYRIVRFDLGAVLLAPEDGGGAVLAIHCQEPTSDASVAAARDRCLETLHALGGRDLHDSQLTVTVTGEGLASAAAAPVARHFAHVPIHADGPSRADPSSTPVGVLLVGNAAHPFSSEDDKFLYFVANRAGDALARLAARLHDERRRLGLMVESMADGLILTDTASDQVLINPAARRMLGIADDLPVTTQFLKDRLGFYPFDLVAASAQPLREEVRIGDQSLHSIVSPVRDGAGKLVGVVVVLRDMTEARELARRQAEFVSVVSHELRTPLTSITGALDLMLSGYSGRVNEKQRRYLEMALGACGRLNIIVDDLLDIARSEDGRMPLYSTPLVLDELSAEVVERYRAAAENKRIHLRFECDDPGIRIVGDPDRLTQVLNNLLSNALKFTPHLGAVEVEVFGPSVASDHVGVSVFNNGEPIPEAARERIFEKFEQLEDSSTRRVGGTGLGLAISRAIVEAHGGRIWVEARGDGTKFVFTLPAAPTVEPEDPHRAETDPIVVPEQQGVMLLVDDDPYATYIMKGILMVAGHEVLTAEDADTALNLARTRQPAVAVVSASMRSADALALVAIFKHDPDTRKTSVLVVGTNERDEALGAGASEFLAKPLQPAAFRETCSRLIGDADQADAPRILLVDDDPHIQAICRDVLERSGYKVRTVSDGLTAIAEARRVRPDLLLLDVMMPHIDGFQTAERLRADSATSMTPIIFLSAKGETSDKVRAFRTGAEDYVVKPFDAAELVARVAKALERHAREVGASPTTQLPGADSIEAEIERRLADGADYAFCYLDLDNLKAFNDYYGYAKADGVIRQTGDVIRTIVAREGNPGDFIGHIAGDDFVFVTTSDRVDRLCATVCDTFDRLVPLYYNKADRERGYIETKDRYGVLRKFPIMSVSIAAVTLDDGHIRTFSALAAAAARGKKLAKSRPGSTYVRDDRVVRGQPAEDGEPETAGDEVA